MRTYLAAAFFLLAVLPAGVVPASPAQEDDARMAAGHAHDTPVATPAATTPPTQPVVAEAVEYATVDGKPVTGWLARPKDARPGLPGLIVIHEWWGLNDNVRDEAERLAAEGYVALAVDLYQGRSASDVKSAMPLSQGLTANPAPGEENLRQAYAYLLKSTGAERIGSIGWCLGGRWSLRAALVLPKDLDAAVIYYGSVNVPEADLAPLTMPVIGFFGTKDPVIPLPTVAAFEANMRKLGKDVEVHVYEGAQHAFANPSGTSYEPVAAEDSWRRTLAFLGKHLKGN
ncbi:MAG: dienelactone hydrolase family protein [Gammaproteobacteria bacterium]|nr:dienelactone hydrolase family protein [Gammaproteobacteria bacterium]